MSTGRHRKSSNWRRKGLWAAVFSNTAVAVAVIWMQPDEAVPPPSTAAAFVAPPVPSAPAPPRETVSNQPERRVANTKAKAVVVPPKVDKGEVEEVVEPVEETVAAESVAAPEPPDGLISAARNYIGRGIPYVWGGKNDSGLDCSGFVWSAFKDLGFDVPYRNSSALKEWTTRVPSSEAQAGDLVFWPGHVGIYIGNGRVIDMASSTGTVTERKIWGSPTFGRLP